MVHIAGSVGGLQMPLDGKWHTAVNQIGRRAAIKTLVYHDNQLESYTS